MDNFFLKARFTGMFCILVNLVFSQPIESTEILLPQATTGRISINYGYHVSLPINSIKKYKEGMSLTDWTSISVSYDDDAGASTWDLSLKANQPNFLGEDGENLPLDFVYVTVTSAGSSDLSSFINSGVLYLSSTSVALVEGAPEGTSAENGVLISYHCGVPPSEKLMGQTPDIYYVDLILILSVH